jgi:YHS domain-containing protein
MKSIAYALSFAALAVLFAAVPAPAFAGEVKVLDVYPLTTCPVTGETLGSMGAPEVKEYEGREVRFCCAACPEKFEQDLAANLTKLDKAIADDQRALYALETCPVSGDALGAMGEPVEVVVDNQLVKLCCAGCEKSLREAPAKYLAKVAEAAAEKQREAYPTDTCIVSDQALDSMGGPVEVIVGGRLVRLCCEGCVKELEKDPAAALQRLQKERDAG